MSGPSAFLRLAVRLGICASIAGGVTIACSPRLPAPAAASVRFDLAADPASLNPLFNRPDAAGVEAEVARLAFEPFIDLDPRGRAIPALLARVPTVANGDLSADGRTIVYHLRPGVRWQDGVPVTARDVLFTLEAIRDPRNPVRSRADYDRIARAERLDDRTVRLTLRAPWAPAVATFFNAGDAPQYVLPAHLLAGHTLTTDAFNARPVGDGPYRLERWVRGERLVYAANRGYWRGAPAVDSLDLRIVADPNTNLTLFRSGRLNWNLIAPAQIPALRDRADIAFTAEPAALVAGLALNVTHPPLDDVRVRRALAASIDRRAISMKITAGRYAVIDTAQPLGSWARDPAVHLPPYDPAQADRLLDAAGWKRGPDGVRMRAGRRLDVTYVQFPETTTGVRTATFVQSELRARGIAVTLKSISNAQLFLPAAQGGALASGAFDIAYVPWPMGADPDDRALLQCGGSENYMRYCNPAVDRLEAAAIATPERAKRRALYAQIERRVAADVPVVYLFNPAYVYAYDRRLRGFAPNAFGATWNAATWRLRRP